MLFVSLNFIYIFKSEKRHNSIAYVQKLLNIISVMLKNYRTV